MLTNLIEQSAQLINGSENDYDRLMRQIDDASIVLLGEASHGTHEFYQERARLSQRLIREKGFIAIAVEADWPDAYRVNQYIRMQNDEPSVDAALSDFKRFPSWMWRNEEVEKLVDWLHRWNQGVSEEQRIGFYGLDLYSLHASSEAVIRYLDDVDEQAAQDARERYGCFEHFVHDMREYSFFTKIGLGQNCEQEVIDQLKVLQRRALDYTQHQGQLAQDQFFNAEQNARIVQNAEQYYRTMFQGYVSSWNLRDRHMVDTVDYLLTYLRRKHYNPKIIIWAHNSHLGDERATELSRINQINVGQLLREKHNDAVFSVGFTTYTGTVTAASGWDKPARVKRVRPALGGSYEALFHEVGIPAFVLNLQAPSLHHRLNDYRLQRAIGVVYLPESERYSHYFEARLSQQFDAVIHFDKTRALTPIEPNPEWTEEVPETYPFSL